MLIRLFRRRIDYNLNLINEISGWSKLSAFRRILNSDKVVVATEDKREREKERNRGTPVKQTSSFNTIQKMK